MHLNTRSASKKKSNKLESVPKIEIVKSKSEKLKSSKKKIENICLNDTLLPEEEEKRDENNTVPLKKKLSDQLLINSSKFINEKSGNS